MKFKRPALLQIRDAFVGMYNIVHQKKKQKVIKLLFV